MKAAIALLFGIAIGCGHSSASRAPAPTRAAELVASLRSLPALSARLSAAQKIVWRDGVYAVAGGFREASSAAVRIEVPATAGGSLRFVDDVARSTWGVRALGLASRPAEPSDGALVYRDVATDTDLVLHAVPSGVEELRVLRSARAPRAFRWSIEQGSARIVDAGLEIRDRHGALRMRVEIPFAIDANGVRRELALRTTGDEVVAELDVSGLRHPIVVDPAWVTVVSTLPAPSSFYAYTWVQPNVNTVLQLGGSNNVGDGSAVFDVPTLKWTPRLVTTSTRTWSNSIWVPSIDKALITGGQTGGGSYMSTAALYSLTGTPVTTELAGTMSVARAFHTLTLLDSGSVERVLVVGGANGTVSVDWFEPSTFTFTARASMATARTRHAASRLASGKVLVSGGRLGSSGAHSSAEVYDPVGNAWTTVPTSMALGRYDHTQSLLSDGRVLIVGGFDALGQPTATTSIYNASTNTLVAGPSLGAERAEHSATTLADGKIFIAGGYGRPVGSGASLDVQATTEIYDPATNALSLGPSMIAARRGHEAAALSSGRVMVGTASGVSTTEILWPDGTSCSSTSGSCPFCVDGVCCDTSCTGQCEACDLAGMKGVCSSVTGEAPHGSRAACSPFAVCVYDPAKASSACATTCTSDTSCASGSYCVSPGTSGTCAPKKANGEGCGASNQCTSGRCVDGVCCATDCTGQCKSCAESGSLGTCVSVDGVPRGTRTACTAPYACSAGACATSCTKDVECAPGRTCDTASSTCVSKKADGATCTAAQQCLSGQCVDGICCNTDCTSACFACDLPGKGGTCSAVAEGSTPRGARTCTPYAVCGAGGACKTSCASGADCVSGVCDSAGKTCSAVPADAGTDGAAADATTDATSTDATTDTATSPDVTDDRGTATRPAPDPGPKPTVGEFIKCTKSSECASGHCVEGVCCDSECSDRCHSCALLASPGRCTLEPIGVDLRSECGPALTCLGTCNGGGECIGAGNGTMCGRNRCTGPSTGVGPAYCRSPGSKCATDDAVPFDCSPYVCEPAFGACVVSCKSSTDCANGFVCEVETRLCVVASPPPVDDSGCTLARSPNHGSCAGSILALGLGVLVARSRSARRASRP